MGENNGGIGDRLQDIQEQNNGNTVSHLTVLETQKPNEVIKYKETTQECVQLQSIPSEGEEMLPYHMIVRNEVTTSNNQARIDISRSQMVGENKTKIPVSYDTEASLIRYDQLAASSWKSPEETISSTTSSFQEIPERDNVIKTDNGNTVSHLTVLEAQKPNEVIKYKETTQECVQLQSIPSEGEEMLPYHMIVRNEVTTSNNQARIDISRSQMVGENKTKIPVSYDTEASLIRYDQLAASSWKSPEETISSTTSSFQEIPERDNVIKTDNGNTVSHLTVLEAQKPNEVIKYKETTQECVQLQSIPSEGEEMLPYHMIVRNEVTTSNNQARIDISRSQMVGENKTKIPVSYDTEASLIRYDQLAASSRKSPEETISNTTSSFQEIPEQDNVIKTDNGNTVPHLTVLETQFEEETKNINMLSDYQKEKSSHPDKKSEITKMVAKVQTTDQMEIKSSKLAVKKKKTKQMKKGSVRDDNDIWQDTPRNKEYQNSKSPKSSSEVKSYQMSMNPGNDLATETTKVKLDSLETKSKMDSEIKLNGSPKRKPNILDSKSTQKKLTTTSVDNEGKKRLEEIKRLDLNKIIMEEIVKMKESSKSLSDTRVSRHVCKRQNNPGFRKTKKCVKSKRNISLEDIIRDEIYKSKSANSLPSANRIMVQYDGKCDETILKSIIETQTGVTFNLTSYQYNGQNVTCIMEFPSNNKTREALKKLKQIKELGIVFKVMSSKPNMVETRRQEKVTETVCVQTTARKLLEKHAGKMKELEKQIGDIVATKRNNLSSLSRLEILENRLAELESQKTEFVRFLNSLIKEYDALDVETSDCQFRNKMDRLRQRFISEIPKFSSALPMYARRSEILKCIENSQVSVILGETGSGKSTQMTQYIVDADLSNHGQIICTQPRKVAAVTLAQRVAEEMGTTVGGRVGYKVGSVEKRTKETQIMYVTDHVLLNECVADPDFSRYSCLIIDEAHERSIYTDLLLGMIKKALEKRRDLRVVITSATIDPDVFIHYFHDCPVLKVSGRTFPVDIFYEDNDQQSSELPSNYIQMAVDKVSWIHQHQPLGDILVFLTSSKETEKASELTEKCISSAELSCLQLHGQQAPNDQQKVFKTTGNRQRRVVFATNCAETSITIPGIKYVVDIGLSKEKQFDCKKNMSSLKVCYISKSSADQRKGRAGRVEPGQCYRLYNESTYNEMKSSSTPEILRTHLGQSLLKLMLLGIQNPLKFDFVQAPPRADFMVFWKNLEELGAVSSDGLTGLGRKLAQLSLEPRIGKLVIDGIVKGIGTEVIIIAALAGVGYNIFFRGKTENEHSKSEKAKIKLAEKRGDVFTALEIFKEWSSIPEKEKRSWCVDNSLNGRWLRTARDDMRELLKLLDKELHLKVKYEYADSSKVEEYLPSIITSCFSPNICFYMGHRRIGYSPFSKSDEVFPIHPSSVVSCLRSESQWIVFENILHTSQQFLINITTLTEKEAMEEVEKRGLGGILEKMKANVVRRCVIPGIGPYVAHELPRKKYGSIWRMENQLQDEFSGVRIALDFDQDAIVLYAKPDQHEIVSSFIQKDAGLIKNDLQMACQENEIIENGGVRYLIKAGGNLKTILMPKESRTLSISNVKEGMMENEIREQLATFGKIENLFKFPVRNKARSTFWGRVTYMDYSSATAASKNLHKDMLGFFLSLLVPNKYAESYKLRISWCRRPLLGFGFAIFRNPFEAVAADVESVVVKGDVVDVQINKKNNSELYLRGIPKDANVDDIKKAFMDEGVQVEEFRLPRTKPLVTSSRQLEMYKRRLRRYFDDLGMENRYDINLFPPRDKDYTVNGNITCTSMEIANQLVQENIILPIDDYQARIQMQLEFQISDFVNKDIYDIVNSDLRKVLHDLDSPATPVQSQILNNGCFKFRVTVSRLEQLQEYRGRISEVLDPEKKEVCDRDQYRLLISGKGRQILGKIMKKERIYIQFDRWRSVLSFYGDARRRNAASKAVEDFLKQSDKYQVRRIQLAGDGIPVGVLRELFRRFNVDLEKLRLECDLASVDVRVRDHMLEICGSTDALDKCNNILQNVITELSQMKRDITNTENETCPVCLCTPDENTYRTEYCAHVYCRDCIDGLVHHAVKDKQLPIECARESCTEYLVLRDFFNLLGQTREALRELSAAATERFVSENSTRYSYCITPDCPIVYKTTRTKHLFQCPNPDCQITICTNCKEKYHDGLSCAMHQGLKGDPDFDVKAWMKQSPETRAPCPRCGRYLEKNGGCMHMRCHCTAHICWRCKQVFATADETYVHLGRCRATP
ncbi:hypothetical protein LSH36_2033g00000 [Paralvinella palmiformis]|uniref:ATP-dependent RNA helicase n=1 Tax=Paralvinella palmiformis TaxID=53620 RepID=A0AAD9IS95_9ANNE|nr:hypothetical protein LSH36_2033g00000 [Paralvinella palmiformis]